MSESTVKKSYAATREVRFGLVLYGGVSLAIYINGVVQELLRLVRATAPKAGSDTELRLSDEALRGSEVVYRELGRRLMDGHLTARQESVGPVQTRFVVDLLTGASAGGINGVFLAKALATDGDLSSLEELWVDKGDFGRLLNDKPSAKDLREVGLLPGAKSSLLNSRWMYTQLLSAVANIKPAVDASPTSDNPSPYADAIDLWVTTTDLEGRVDIVDTTDSPAGRVVESSNRALLHFSFAAPAVNGGEERNDFADENNAMLAFAARATSSFPAAFEPMRLNDADRVVEALKLAPEQRRPSTLENFFPLYRLGDAVNHSFADGGYLDNKPFEQILRTLPLRRASLPVERKIFYVEPDPGGPPLIREDANPRPDLVATVLAVVTTPRNETIASDVSAIRQFGATGRVRRDAYNALTKALDEQLSTHTVANVDEAGQRLLDAVIRGAAPRDSEPDDLEAIGSLLHDWSPTASAYRSLRDARVAQEIAGYLARVLPSQPQDEGSELHLVMTHLVAEMLKDQELLESSTLRGHFDALYHLRRINFLQKRAVDAACNPTAIGIAADPTITIDAAQLVRRRLDVVFAHIRQNTRAIRRPRSITSTNPCAPQIEGILAQFRQLNVSIDVDHDNESASPPKIPAATDVVAAYRSSAPLRKACTELLEAVSTQLNLGGQARQAWQAISETILPLNLRRELQTRWILFRFYDEVGLAFDELPGESSDIAIHRISPLDAVSLVPEVAKRYEKLAGSAVGHFGGFFMSAWRRNDILWGRLDAAERIIDALVPPDQADARKRLVGDAHLAILTEAWAHLPTRREVLAPIAGIDPSAADLRSFPDSLDPTKSTLTALASQPRTPLKPSTHDWMSLSARALRVTNAVTTDISVDALDARPLIVFAARVMKFAANVLEFLTGERLKTTILRNFLVVIALLGFLIGVVGTVTSNSALSRTGWSLFAATLIVRVVADTVADRIGGKSSNVRWFLRVSVLVIVAAAVGGLIVLHSQAPGWRPVIYTGGPTLVILIAAFVANRFFAAWKVALAALAGTAMSLAYYGLRHIDTLQHLIRGKPVP